MPSSELFTDDFDRYTVAVERALSSTDCSALAAMIAYFRGESERHQATAEERERTIVILKSLIVWQAGERNTID